MEKDSVEENNNRIEFIDNSPPKKRLKTEDVESSASINSNMLQYGDQVLDSADNRFPGKEKKNSEKKKSVSGNLWLREPGGFRRHLLTGVERFDCIRIKVPSPAFLISQRPEIYSLSALSLGRDGIDIADLAELLFRCPHLCELRIHIDPLNQGLCHIIGTKLTNLTTLTLKLHGNVSCGLKVILLGCQRLTSLHLQQCSTRNVPLDFIRELPSSIRSFKAVHFTFLSSDNDVELLISKCPAIECLAMSVAARGDAFTAETVLSLTRLKGLKVLKLDCGSKVADLDLSRLKKVSSLKFLQISGKLVPDAELAKIRSSLPGVTIICCRPSIRVKTKSTFKRKRDRSGRVQIVYQQETKDNFDIEKFMIKMEQFEKNGSEGEERANVKIEKFDVKKEITD